MPLYEYECEACGARFEQIQRFSDPPIEVCPNCGERMVHKLLSSPAIQFKGSGWYVTDYARKGGKETDAGGKESKESNKESKESGESKTESKESGESKESAKSNESKESKTPSSPPATSSKDS
jgi:putative FmdB family regulatory protein